MEPEATSNEPVAEPRKPRTPRSVGLGRFLVDTYATADPRSLGLFRIALGVLLFVDAARRYPDIEAHYANTGWLSNHFMLFRPMSSYLFSLYLACSTPGEVKLLLFLQLLVDALLIIGFRTRLMHFLALVLLVSLNSRNIMLENGGWVVLTLLTTWSLFLPLNRRFSVDAILASLRRDRSRSLERLNAPLERDTKPVVSLAVSALILQWAVIYYFNVVHKNGPQWRDGTAVYYFFQQDRMVTWFGAWLRDVLPIAAYKGMTFGALAIESSVALLLILPFKPHYTRMLAWLLVCMLHLSIDSVVQLGPFSWAMVVMFFALIPPQLWARLGASLRKYRPERSFVVAGDNPLSLAFARVIKRLDTLERVSFVNAVEAAEEPVPCCSTLDQASGRCYQGAAALLRVADAFPLGARPLGWLAFPPFAGVTNRFLARAAADTGALARYYGVYAGPDDVAAPSDAQRFFARVAWIAGECAVAFLLVCCGSQVLTENAAVPERVKQLSHVRDRPEWMTAVVVYPRLFQGWSMFAPSPPTDDGRLVVDGRTKDGRHFDPLTGQVPSFDVQPKGGYRMNQIWGDFHRRVAEERFRVYWQGVRDFIKNHHEITGRPEDELEAFDVWFVSEQIPPPGGAKMPPSKRKLMTYGTVRD